MKGDGQCGDRKSNSTPVKIPPSIVTPIFCCRRTELGGKYCENWH